MYSLLIDTYIKDTTEKRYLFNAIETVPCVKKKADWALKYINNGFVCRNAWLLLQPWGNIFLRVLLPLSSVEKRGLMPGLSTSNEFISRDEECIADFAAFSMEMLETKLTQERIYEIIKDAVAKWTWVCDRRMLYHSSVWMQNWCASTLICCDRLLESLGYPKVYNSTNPFVLWSRFPCRQNKLFWKKSEWIQKSICRQSKEDNVFKNGWRLLDLRNTNQYQYTNINLSVIHT